MIELEICANSVESCIAAEKGGATRVELCAGIPEGGTTPSAGEIATAKRLTDIPIHVIIRPRAGDFVYSKAELDAMCYDIDVARELGCEGVVFGCLTPRGAYDVEANRILLKRARDMRCTFHRAIDVSHAPLETLACCIADHFSLVLTSGAALTAIEGAGLIARMVDMAGGRIGVMAGSGVRKNNIEELVKKTGVRNVHASLRTETDSPMEFRHPLVSMGGTVHIDEYKRVATYTEDVYEAVQKLSKL